MERIGTMIHIYVYCIEGHVQIDLQIYERISQIFRYVDRQTEYESDDQEEEEEHEQIESAPHREFYSFKVAATAADD